MRYLLVDSNHLSSRCRHTSSGQSLKTSDGRRSGVVSGVLRSISWIKRQSRVEDRRIICFWDGGRSQKRMDLYPEYKSGRTKEDPTPEEVLERQEYYLQLDALREALGYTGMRQVKVAGTEADDLIAIYAHLFASQNADVIVFSGDHDLHQLVNSRISVHDPKKELLDTAMISEIWGLTNLSLIPIVKALSGDSSDAIKGVPGIGKKRALLIAPYHDTFLGDGSRPTGIPDKTWKWIEKAYKYQDIVLRNLQLMQLPKDFKQSLYTPEQASEVIRQVQAVDSEVSMRKFLEFCKDWELVSILENLHYWQ